MFTTEEARRFERQMLIDEYLRQPPQVQSETRARVADTLRRERQLAPTQHSALWRLAPSVYGVNPETC
jgi:hypothetical protein